MSLDQALFGVSAELPQDRVMAVRALGAFRSEKALEVLIAACSDEHMMVRRFAVRSLRSLDRSEGLSAAIGCLADKYGVVRLEAALAVTALSDRPTVEWMAIYDAAADSRTKAEALRSLTNIDPLAVAADIRAAAMEEDMLIRTAGIHGLAALGEDADLKTLRVLAADQDYRIRLAVADACARLKDVDEALEIISLLRRDKEQGVRWRFIHNLESVNSPRVGALYLAVLRDESVDDLRVKAAKSIWKVEGALALLSDVRHLLELEGSMRVREALKATIVKIEDENRMRSSESEKAMDTHMRLVRDVERVGDRIHGLEGRYTEALRDGRYYALQDLIRQISDARAVEQATMKRLVDSMVEAMCDGTVEDVRRLEALLDQADRHTAPHHRAMTR